MENRPHIENANHTLTVQSLGDSIVVAPDQVMVLEDVRVNTGLFPDNARTFTLLGNKVYHLRFSLNGESINSLPLQKLSFYVVEGINGAYNPVGLDPLVPSNFMTDGSDMLIAIVDTAGGTAAVTPVVNDREAIETHAHTHTHTAAEISGLDAVTSQHYHPTGIISDEAAVGAVNGANAVFTTASEFQPGTLVVFLNGLRQLNADYAENGRTGFTLAVAPLTGDAVTVDYVKYMAGYAAI